MSSDDAPTPPPRKPLVRWLSTSNPFYVISAGLFLFGLRDSFSARAGAVDSWALMGGLAGYTLLLAVAALVLVRFAGVWNDVRTVLLLVVLMFLATSVTFDELIVLDPERGKQFNICGLAFAMLLTEGLLRSIRLRLPLLFRLPYHLTLALFFLYPVALIPLFRERHSEALMWALWGFSPLAGLVFLTLLPAIRRGAEYVRDTGSPWPWPFYPWSVFVFLAVAVCGRAFLLCWSLDMPYGVGLEELVFGPHFLVPFGFVLALLVLELGIVSRHWLTQVFALLMPVVLVVVSAVGHRAEGVYAEFLDHFSTRLGGTPLFLSLLAATGFYLLAWLRGVSLALEGLTLAVAALSIFGPNALSLSDVTPVRTAPLIGAITIQVLLALWENNRWRLVVGGLAATCWLVWVGYGLYKIWREYIVGLDFLLAGVFLLPVAVLVSLGKAGVLARWWQKWCSARRGTPTPAE